MIVCLHELFLERLALIAFAHLILLQVEHENDNKNLLKKLLISRASEKKIKCFVVILLEVNNAFQLFAFR